MRRNVELLVEERSVRYTGYGVTVSLPENILIYESFELMATLVSGYVTRKPPLSSPIGYCS